MKKILSSIKNKKSTEPKMAPIQVPKQSYAEALMMRNANVVKTRNITIKNIDDESTLLNEIKKDKLFNGVSVEKVKKLQSNKLNIKFANPIEANKFENIFTAKYKDKVDVSKPKELASRFKIVNIPSSELTESFTDLVYECNNWLETGTFTKIREYSSFEPFKNIM